MKQRDAIDSKQNEAFSSISFKLLARDVIFGEQGDKSSRSKQIEQQTGISYKRLSNCCNSNQGHCFNVDDIAAITNATGDYRMVEDLCRKCGGTFQLFDGNTEMRLIDINNAGEGVFELVAHIGKLAQEYKKSKRDDKISPTECSRLDRLLLAIREGSIELSALINRLVIK